MTFNAFTVKVFKFSANEVIPDICGCIFGLYIPTFGLNTEIYSVNHCVQSKYEKIRTGKNSVFWHFSRSANSQKSVCFHKFWKVFKKKKSQIFALLIALMYNRISLCSKIED